MWDGAAAQAPWKRRSLACCGSACSGKKKEKSTHHTCSLGRGVRGQRLHPKLRLWSPMHWHPSLLTPGTAGTEGNAGRARPAVPGCPFHQKRWAVPAGSRGCAHGLAGRPVPSWTRVAPDRPALARVLRKAVPAAQGRVGEPTGECLGPLSVQSPEDLSWYGH